MFGPTTLIRDSLALLLMLASLIALLARPAGAVEIIDPTNDVLSLEVNKGRLVRLPSAASTVFVANPEVADIQVRSPRLIYLLGKAPGETTVIAVDKSERILANMDLRVTANISGLRRAVAAMHPDELVRVSAVAGSIVLEGQVGSSSAAEDLRGLAARFAGADTRVVNKLGIKAPSQVNLRVRVAEVSRDLDKQLGFNWSILGSVGGFSLGLATTNPFASSVTAHTLSAAGSLTENWSADGIVDAMEQEGLLTVLAEPNLTAMSGETASFLAGGEFPILVPGSDGSVTIQFKKYGVSLAFTPTIIDQRINLHVRPEVSELSSTNSVTLNNFTVPALVTRRAETTVELGSGQSFAIGGLIQNNTTQDISKFPGLGDLPVIGALFRSDRFQREESELVIIVTPYVVKPVAAAALATPNDGYRAPTDGERLTKGGTYGQSEIKPQPINVTAAGDRINGPVGFQLD